MTSAQYIKYLSDKFSNYFDIDDNYHVDGQQIDLYAKSNIRNEKYVLSKKAVIWSYENNEHCLVKLSEDSTSHTEIINFIELLKTSVSKIVIPSEDHMSSVITGIYISDTSFNDSDISLANKFKYSKLFSLGFKGWCDVRLVLVDLAKDQIYTNKKGREVKDFYFSILNNNN